MKYHISFIYISGVRYIYIQAKIVVTKAKDSNKMLISDTQKDRTLSVGRKKKPDRSRRSVRFDNKALAMLQIYAERNGLDVTSALNQLLLTHLRAMGLEPEAEEIVNKLRQDEDGE